MKKVLQKILIPAICTLPAYTLAQSGQVQLSNQSKLSINGKSNVNDFRCISNHNLQQDSLNFTYQYAGDRVFVNGISLNLEVVQFDCGKKGINRDFKSTLKYKEHPFIQISLNEVILDDSEDFEPTAADLTIEIAGVEQHHLVPLNGFSRNDGVIQVGGSTVLLMSDFDLTPPSPLFGLVQVSDELDIVFDLVINLDN